MAMKNFEQEGHSITLIGTGLQTLSAYLGQLHFIKELSHWN